MIRMHVCLLLLAAILPVLRADEKHVDQQGDPLPKDAIARLGTLRWRLGGYIHGLAFAPDGKTVASGSIDNTVRLWDADSGKELRSFPGHDPWVVSVAISPDGKLLASGGAGKRIHLCDLATGKKIRECKGHDGVVSCLAFSPDGKVLASGSGVISGGDSSARLWDVATGKELFHLKHNGDVRGLTFTPDGKFLATACEDRHAHLWDVATGKHHGGFRALLAGNRFPELTRVAVSPDGKLLAAGTSRFDPMVIVWEINGGTELHRLEWSRGEVTGLAFTPDGKRLAAAHGHKPSGTPRVQPIVLWDVKTGKETDRFGEEDTSATSLTISRDGRRMAVGIGTVIRVWDLVEGKEMQRHPAHKDSIFTALFSPDGKTIATSGSDGTVRLWEAKTGAEGRLLALDHSSLRPLGFSADGKQLVTTAKDVVVWDVETGKQMRRIPLDADAWVAAVSPDASLLVIKSTRGPVELMETATGKNLGGFDEVYAREAFFSADGKQLGLYTNPNGEQGAVIQVWDLRTRKRLHTVDLTADDAERAVDSHQLRFTPDARGLLMVRGNHRAVIRNLTTGKEVRFPEQKHPIHRAALSPDGKRLALGNWDHSVRLYDVESRKLLAEFRGHQGGVYALAFSPDGKLLCSGSSDSTALVWDVK
jgi:WD40 repeat protein